MPVSDMGGLERAQWLSIWTTNKKKRRLDSYKKGVIVHFFPQDACVTDWKKTIFLIITYTSSHLLHTAEITFMKLLGIISWAL